MIYLYTKTHSKTNNFYNILPNSFQKTWPSPGGLLRGLRPDERSVAQRLAATLEANASEIWW